MSKSMFVLTFAIVAFGHQTRRWSLGVLDGGASCASVTLHTEADAPIKACEEQQETWETAKSLLEDFEDFLVIEKHIEALKKRRETSRTVIRMFSLMKTACDYICEKTKDGYFGTNSTFVSILHVHLLTCEFYLGNLFGQAYKDHIDGFKNDLERTKNAFNRSVLLEIFEAIDGIGKHFT